MGRSAARRRRRTPRFPCRRRNALRRPAPGRQRPRLAPELPLVDPRRGFVINPKGGSGKTTLAVNLAACLAADGIPTTLMDYDPQVPPATRHLIIDSPAAASGVLVHEMVERAHCVLVPVVPSVIDIRATENFINALLAIPRVRSGDARVGLVANKVRVSMPAYQPFLRFLESLEVSQIRRVNL